MDLNQQINKAFQQADQSGWARSLFPLLRAAKIRHIELHLACQNERSAILMGQ